MTIRTFAALLPVAAILAAAAPVANASAATTPPLSNPAGIACYPYPAFCGPNGQQWAPIPSWWPLSPNSNPSPWGPGPIQLPLFPIR
jgi:hypothetical protein